MTRQFLIASLLTAATAFTCHHAVAQNFIPQTKPIPGENYGTHADAMRVLGAPGSNSRNDGLPMQDTYGTNSRWDTIFQRGDYAPRNYNVQPQNWNRQPTYNYNYNNNYNRAQVQAAQAAQIQQSIQQLGQAFQQMRQQRMQRMNYQNNYRPQANWGNNYYRRW